MLSIVARLIAALFILILAAGIAHSAASAFPLTGC